MLESSYKAEQGQVCVVRGGRVPQALREAFEFDEETPFPSRLRWVTAKVPTEQVSEGNGIILLHSCLTTDVWKHVCL